MDRTKRTLYFFLDRFWLWYHPGQAGVPDSTLDMFKNLKTVKTRDVTQREFCFFAAAAAAADTSPARTVVF